MSETPIPELVKKIKAAYGMTWAEMGAAMGRSEKMMRKLATGQSTGERYRRSLEELYSNGAVEHMTPRRRTRQGKLVPVRAKAGAGDKSQVPDDTRGSSRAAPGRYRWVHRVQHLPAGVKVREARFNPSPGTTTHARGGQAFKADLQSVTRSQKKVDKRVKLTVTVRGRDGRLHDYQLGSKSGFHSSDVLSDINSRFGGNSFDWLHYQISMVYPDADVQVTGYSMTEFSATRTKKERQQQDYAGTRRRRRSRGL